MNEEVVRGRLMDALVDGVGSQMPPGRVWNLDKAMRALLPVVREIAAEELRRAYVEDRTTVEKMTPIERLTCFVVKMEDLVVRADALTNPEASPNV